MSTPVPFQGSIYGYAGTPGNGTNQVNTITIGGTPTAGSFTITFAGQTTAAITWSATNATLVANIQAALDALGSIGTSNTLAAVGTATAGIGTFTVTFQNTLGAFIPPAMTVTSSLTGTSPTLAIATTTAGVEATPRGLPTGAIVVNTTAGIPYVNQGTSTAPTYVKVSAS